MKTENISDKGVALQDQIKAIKHDLKSTTQQIMDELTRDYMTYVMVDIEKEHIMFLFRPDNESVPIPVFTIQNDPRDNTWMITTIGGDYRAKIFYQLAELCNALNHYKIRDIAIWFK